MRRVFMTLLAGALGCSGVEFAAVPALATDLCVGPLPGCFSTINAALDAAQDGDTIRIGPGRFAGGITIDKDVALLGVSAEATFIEGGGPVITIGDGTASLTVSIHRVTITGGFNDSKPESPVGSGFFAAGGGVLIPEAAGRRTGATVTITDSVISGNRVTAGAAQPFCGPWACSFASGGGVANWGTLTVTNTRIVDNVAGATATSGGLATDARGGGIWNSGVGAVTLRHSWVTGNRAAVSAPNGSFAEGGGISDDGTLRIERGVVSGNTADARTAVPSTFPIDVRTEAVGGGIRISEAPGAAATITGTTISDNHVISTNVGGDAQATSGGIDVDGSLLLVDSRVGHNTVQARVPFSSGNLAGALFGGLEVQGEATIRNSSVSGNLLTAVSPTGAANVAGGGVGNLSGRVILERTQVTGNRGRADGVGGLVLGGGIVSVVFGGGPPDLALSKSVVTANQLVAPGGVTPRGGGIFSADPFSNEPIPFALTRTVVAGNRPDQCVGC